MNKDLLNKFYSALAMKLLTFRMMAVNGTKTEFSQKMIEFSRELIQDYHDTVLNNRDILLDLAESMNQWMTGYLNQKGFLVHLENEETALCLSSMFMGIRPTMNEVKDG